MSTNTPIRIAAMQRPVNLLEIAQRGKTPQAAAGNDTRASFKEMFSQQLASEKSLTVSKPAHARLHSRGIELTEQQVADISAAIDKAESRGSKETLVLGDEFALVVSVPNRTVITAFDRGNLHDGVVTSIDSAVML